LKATSVVAAAVFVGSEFQSRIVRGKKEYFLLSLLLDGKTHHEDVAISKEERLIPPKRTTRNMHPLSFQVPSSSSDNRKYSFFPRTIRDWNSLPTNTAAATTLVAFKAQVSQLPH
jgi:hypothetical protein